MTAAAAAPSAVGACEACGALAHPSLSLHWVPHLKAVLCCNCKVHPLKLWVTNRLTRIASGVRPWALLLVALLLTGCGGGLVRVNPGAPVAWYVGTPSDLRAYVERSGEPAAAWPQYYGGLYDREAQVIITARSFDLGKRRAAQEIGWNLNEFCSLVQEVGDPWVAAYLVTGGDLDALCGDLADAEMAPASEAKVRALIEARRAAQALP